MAMEEVNAVKKVILLRDTLAPCPEGDVRNAYWEMPDGSPAIESCIRIVREVTNDQTSVTETFYEVQVPAGVYLTRIAACDHQKQLDGRMFIR
jgi:hypothetical protein